ncbi:MAG: lipopolysaccharide biosynthesis protein [Gammaproteobacteria bacterium]|nr:lipopolysaccharide biosynthesis protein [Gammaproteobacteria bacterium]
MNTMEMRAAQDFELLDEAQLSIEDYIAILKRRRWRIIVPAAVVFFLALLLALGLPATYRSTATILIEEQEIPQDLVRSTISSFAAEQVQVITQRVMTVENILQTVDKLDLYGQRSADSKMPRTTVAEKFREDVKLDLVSADVLDPRSGRAMEATIAFTLAFDERNPATAQKVTNELVTLYLNENLRSRSVKASSASQFLGEEAEALNVELKQLEGELASFKEQHKGALPEFYQFNLSVVERTEREISEVGLRLQELEKRKIQLSSEIAQLNPSAPVILPTGEAVLSDMDRLKALQSEYRRKSAVYHDSHPDVVRLKREIEALQSELGVGDDPELLREQLATARDQLAGLRNRYTADHPQVSAAERVVKDLEAALAQASRPGARRPDAPQADNPAYVMLQTQLSAGAAEARSLNDRRVELRAKLAEYEALLQKAPAVEADYQALQREYATANAKYQELRAKQREADVSKNLEKERKGQRFTLIEPPDLPLLPVSPNRIALILVGLILAGAAGLGSAVLAEATDKSVRGEKALAKLTGTPPFVVIPYLDNSADTLSRAKTKRQALIASGAAALIFILYVHFFYKPLDVLWFVIIGKLGAL